MKRPALMGILNITPDSFSGDGVMGAGEAVAQALRMMEDGADIIDIGAESTRPGAVALDADTEWFRLEPVLTQLAARPWRAQVRLSIDTRHAQTAARALALGVDIINDVGGFTEHAMLEILGGANCDCVVMHALTLPADPGQVWPPETDAVAEILRWKEEVTARAVGMGITPERLVYDPGLGFGKDAGHSLTLVLAARELVAPGGRWLFGHSRKSFLSLFADTPASGRTALTLAFSTMLADAGVPYLRVHDVAAHRELFGRLCT